MADTKTDKICDRCGRPYSENGMSGVITCKFSCTDATLELCGDCMNSFTQWFNFWGAENYREN